LLHIFGYLRRCTKMMHGHTNIKFMSVTKSDKCWVTQLLSIICLYIYRYMFRLNYTAITR